MSEIRMLTLGLACAALLGAGAQTAVAGDQERILDYRQGVMDVFSWNMKAMGAMMKGEAPYDQALFARHASDLAKATSLDVLAGFPPDSDQGETDARPDIWLDFEDFKQKLENLRQASQSLNEVAAAGDKAAMGEALGKTGKQCKACHESYKD